MDKGNGAEEEGIEGRIKRRIYEGVEGKRRYVGRMMKRKELRENGGEREKEEEMKESDGEKKGDDGEGKLRE